MGWGASRETPGAAVVYFLLHIYLFTFLGIGLLRLRFLRDRELLTLSYGPGGRYGVLSNAKLHFYIVVPFTYHFVCRN